MFKQFLRDPYFLLKYAVINVSFLSLACLFLILVFERTQILNIFRLVDAFFL